MNKVQFSIIVFISFFIGMLFFAYQQEWIIIRLPWKQEKAINSLSKPTKQQVHLYYWKNQEWKKEEMQILQTPVKEEQLYNLINAWLTLVYDEYQTTNKTTLETIALNTGNQQIYVSFDKSLFPTQWSLYQKWMFVEGLLKTIHQFDYTITSVQFLIKHTSMKDAHLDFSRPWPIQGFSK